MIKVFYAGLEDLAKIYIPNLEAPGFKEMHSLMSRKAGAERSQNGWRYQCDCGFETLSVGDAVGHLNRNRQHQLRRFEL